MTKTIQALVLLPGLLIAGQVVAQDMTCIRAGQAISVQAKPAYIQTSWQFQAIRLTISTNW